jgi:hypothetical protein
MNLVMESIILRPIASRGQRSPGAKPTGPSEFREDSSLELLSFQLREFYGRVLMLGRKSGAVFGFIRSTS